MDKKSKAKKQAAKQQPTLDDLISQIQGEEEDTVSSRRDAVDKSREAGLDVVMPTRQSTVTPTPPTQSRWLSWLQRWVVSRRMVVPAITVTVVRPSLSWAQDDDYRGPGSSGS